MSLIKTPKNPQNPAPISPKTRFSDKASRSSTSSASISCTNFVRTETIRANTRRTSIRREGKAKKRKKKEKGTLDTLRAFVSFLHCHISLDSPGLPVAMDVAHENPSVFSPVSRVYTRLLLSSLQYAAPKDFGFHPVVLLILIRIAILLEPAADFCARFIFLSTSFAYRVRNAVFLQVFLFKKSRKILKYSSKFLEYRAMILIIVRAEQNSNRNIEKTKNYLKLQMESEPVYVWRVERDTIVRSANCETM